MAMTSENDWRALYVIFPRLHFERLVREEVIQFYYEPNGQNTSTNMEYGTMFGTLIATLQDNRVGDDREFNDMVLERDQHCAGHGRMGTDEGSRRGVLGARFLGFEPTTMTPTFSYATMSDSSRKLPLRTSTPGYPHDGLRGCARRNSLRALRDLSPS